MDVPYGKCVTLIKKKFLLFLPFNGLTSPWYIVEKIAYDSKWPKTTPKQRIYEVIKANLNVIACIE